MVRKLKEWKKMAKAGKGPGKQQGFGASQSVSEPAAPAPAPTPPSPPRATTANDAISELMRRGQEDADPSKLTPQQIVMVFFSFFAGWRKRNGILSPMQLTPQQKQLVFLLIQGSLGSVSAARDFWPTLCAELGSGKEPEVRELIFALTGMRQ